MSKLLGLKSTDNSFNTPAITKGITDEIKRYMEEGDANIEKNWVNKETQSCRICNGSGLDTDEAGVVIFGSRCIACDGTGVDYEMVYGVEDGVAYAKVIQNGMQAILDVCKAKRERETKNWTKQAGKEVFMLPNSARLELIAQGYPVEEWEEMGDMRSYAQAVQKHFPMFMTTNLNI